MRCDFRNCLFRVFLCYFSGLCRDLDPSYCATIPAAELRTNCGQPEYRDMWMKCCHSCEQAFLARWIWPFLIWMKMQLNTLRPRQNGRHFADDTFKHIFMNENVRFSINISLKFVPKGLINNIPELVQIMAWRRPGDKPLSEPMMVNLLAHLCVTRPQWVNWA